MHIFILSDDTCSRGEHGWTGPEESKGEAVACNNETKLNLANYQYNFTLK